ncbi:hypothetical protein MRX96_041929 [Rhipicephalus microplus]
MHRRPRHSSVQLRLVERRASTATSGTDQEARVEDDHGVRIRLDGAERRRRRRRATTRAAPATPPGSDSFTAELVVSEAPRLQPFYFPKEHPLLETLVVSCIAIRGTQPVHFAWLKDGRPVEHGGGRAVAQQLSATLSTLTIPQVTAQDVGNYTCRASNAVGSDSYSAELLVTDEPRIQPLAFPPSVAVGQEVSVTCVAALGRKPFRFAWTQGRPVPREHRKEVLSDCTRQRGHAHHSADLRFSPKISPTLGTSHSASTRKRVLRDVPTISEAFVVAAGDTAVRVLEEHGPGSEGQCGLCGDRRRGHLFHFAWTHNNRPVRGGGNSATTKYVKQDTANIATLTLEKASAEDIGNYTCAVTSAHGTDSYTATLVVRGLPAIMPFSFPENVRLGQKITVMCVVSSGAGPFQYAWTHGGTALTGSSRKHVKVLAENVEGLDHRSRRR